MPSLFQRQRQQCHSFLSVLVWFIGNDVNISFSLIIYQKQMPPKKYSTETKITQRFIERTPTRMISIRKSTVKKFTDLKRITVSNISNNVVFKDGQIQQKYAINSEIKKKSFVVSKRKKNMTEVSYSQDLSFHNQNKKNKNAWIAQVEYESYQGFRDYNQDRILIKQNLNLNPSQFISVYAVFDGHGGSSVAQYLKLNFIKVLQKFMNIQDIEQSLKKTMNELQQKILQNGIKLGSGSCATVMIVRQDQYWVANVGDSRLLIVKNNQQFIQVTDDHKPENPKQQQRIEKLGGKIYRNVVIDQVTGEKSYGPFRVLPSRLSVSRTIGDYLIKKNQNQKLISPQCDVFKGKLQFGDVVLIFTDGVYEQFSNSELSILFSNYSKQNIRTRLNNYIVSAKKRNTNDNVSIICIQIQNKNNSPSTSSGSPQQSLQKISVQI